MFKSIYLPSPPRGLVEALDSNDRPLCLLAAADILAQSLLHREVAVFAVSHEGSIMLAEIAGPIFDATVSAPIQAGMTAGECAESLLMQSIGQIAPLRKTKEIHKDSVLLTIYTARYSMAMLKALKSTGFLLADAQEIVELDKRGLVTRLVMDVLPHISWKLSSDSF